MLFRSLRFAVDGATLQIDLTSTKVFLNGSVVCLTSTEYTLLVMLAQEPRPVKIQHVIEMLYGVNVRKNLLNNICVFIYRIRRAIGPGFVRNDKDGTYQMIGRVEA